MKLRSLSRKSNDADDHILLNPSGNVGIGTSSPACKLQVAGDICATGDITAYYSDFRLKENLNEIEDFDHVLESLTGYRFNWNDKGRAILNKSKDDVDVGLIAQDVQTVIPQAVKINPSSSDVDPGVDYLTIKYDKILPFLIQGYKSHNKIEATEKQVEKFLELGF